MATNGNEGHPVADGPADEEIRQFIAIWQEEFGETLTLEEARIETQSPNASTDT